jgi:hypothetical protein
LLGDGGGDNEYRSFPGRDGGAARRRWHRRSHERVTSRAEGAEAESREKEDERAELEGTGNVRWYMTKTVVSHRKKTG